ncbi:MAG: DinB family protein [Planctomycetota bacterium]
MTSDPLDILLRHFAWANRVVLDACRPLSREQLHQSFDIGLGSVHATVLHIVCCVEGWTQRAQGNPWTTQDAEAAASDSAIAIDALIARSDRATHAIGQFTEELRRNDQLGYVHESTFHPKDAPPVTVRYTNGAAITHCLVHGQYHRAQAINMLRRLGVTPLPEVDIMDWHHEVEGNAP